MQKAIKLYQYPKIKVSIYTTAHYNMNQNQFYQLIYVLFRSTCCVLFIQTYESCVPTRRVSICFP